MEICIDSIESAKRAIRGGATRLEVCSALSEGGLTPSPGLVRFIKAYSSITIYAMIRIKSDNFFYTEEEMDAMLYDLTILRDIGVDGFVFGALKFDNAIDTVACKTIIAAAKPKGVTFHRAFDVVNDPFHSLEQLIDLGFERILTSGQKNTAIEGIDLIKELIIRAADRIIVMPGSGITPDNLRKIKNISRAKEFHASAKKSTPEKLYPTMVKIGNKTNDTTIYACEDLIKQMVNIINY